MTKKVKVLQPSSSANLLIEKSGDNKSKGSLESRYIIVILHRRSGQILLVVSKWGLGLL